jgi:hypothetical protein
MRTKIVKVADKDILIQEKTIGEIKKIVNELNIDFSKLMQTELEKENFLSEVLSIVQDRIEILFPQLKDIDMDNVYISELENLIDGFLEVNFSMLKKVFIKATTMM